VSERASDLPQSRDEWELKGNAPMTRKQQKLLNACCGCLEQMRWHGLRFGKDDYRHLLSAVVLGERLVPGVNTGQGPPGLIRMARSSMELTKSQATEAIRMAIDVGDNPRDQSLDCPPVRWSDVVLRALGHNPEDFR
jgi:hypothetical protein